MTKTKADFLAAVRKVDPRNAYFETILELEGFDVVREASERGWDHPERGTILDCPNQTIAACFINGEQVIARTDGKRWWTVTLSEVE